ncbi:beta strand repeat-containing protein, partial [Tahibacter aquaticus]|uniref:beta strand repeat-containing protein n=1 Tax=Tahibacter aquaticus TaxID=520092 RepID=UPI001414F67B
MTHATSNGAVPALHTTASAFDSLDLAATGSTLANPSGAAGPTQVVVASNGRLRTYSRAGVADGVLDTPLASFFAAAMTPLGGGVLANSANTPNVRYDRFTARWILAALDAPCTVADCSARAPNRVLLAVSDAASSGTIAAGTVWTFFSFPADAATIAAQLSLGVDVNALYVGANMFTPAGSLAGTNGYVVRKSSILGTGPITVTAFANLVSGGTGVGPFAPRGVDNVDPGATEGYFIGVDNATFSTLMLRRVSNPGSATPTISANLSLTVPTTTFPARVPHLGNTGGANGQLNALDDRLGTAVVRNGRLWTAHNFRVNTAGVASTAAGNRVAVRWYELQNLSTTPSLVESGTIFDNAATNPAQYFVPTATVTGQGHAVMGFTRAGTQSGATPAYTSRLAGDTLGTTAAVTLLGTSTANYNPASDPGGATGRAWGEASATVVDPIDDMTVWTFQQYNQALDSWALRVGRLAAPAPATPTCSGSPIAFNGPTGNIVINATSSGGSGFYDPGANLPAPAQPFAHITATMSNATVNSVTFNSPTQVTLNVTAPVGGLQNVTITNPDGQSVTANGCVTVSVPVPDLAITNTDGVTTAVPGGSVTYTITASNPSAVAATGATVADTFPAIATCTWTCVGAGGGTCTASGSGTINDTVNLPAGASTTYTASCAINAAATGTVSNTATVTIAGDPNPANDSATDTDTLTPSANLGITKTDGVTTATPGGSVTYTITASNAGPSNAPGSTVADTFPASQTCTWTCAGAGGGTCTASGSGNINDTTNLPSGGSTTYTASCAISAAATGTLSNTATVTSPVGVTDPTPGNNSATDSDTLGASADLSITKTDGVTTAIPGGSVTYTITASNAGPSNAAGATVADTFPASETCSWTCVGAGGGTCTASGSGNINDTTNLPSGGSVTYTASCTISAAATGTLSNTATVATPGGVSDPTPGNNSATDSDTLGASADLSITKTDGVTSATPGGSVTYT